MAYELERSEDEGHRATGRRLHKPHDDTSPPGRAVARASSGGAAKKRSLGTIVEVDGTVIGSAARTRAPVTRRGQDAGRDRCRAGWTGAGPLSHADPRRCEDGLFATDSAGPC